MKQPQPKLPVVLTPAIAKAKADAFVAGVDRVPVKRLTIDLTPEQHSAFKSWAAIEGTSMVDLVRKWIDDFLEARKPRQSVAES